MTAAASPDGTSSGPVPPVEDREHDADDPVADAPHHRPEAVERRVDERHADERDVARLAAPHLVSAGAVGVVVLVLVVRLAGALVDVAGLTAAALALAILTNPVRDRLARWLGGAGSITVTAVLTLAVAVGLGAAAISDLGTQVAALAALVREQLSELQPGSLPAQVAGALRIDAALAEWSGEVPTQVVTGQDTGVAAGRRVLSVFFVVVLAAFLQGSRRTIVDRAVARWPRDDAIEPAGAASRTTVRTFIDDLDRRGAGFARRALLLAAACTALIAVPAALLDVPGALVLGMWAGAWAVVPSVGWFVACLPVGAIAAIGQDRSSIAVAVLTLVAAAGTALVRRRLLEPSSLRLGASVHVAAVALGAAVAGVAGTLVAVVLAAIGVAAVTSAVRPRWPREVATARAELRLGARAFTIAGGAGRLAVLALVTAGAGAFLLAVLGRSIAWLAWFLVAAFVAIALHRPACWLEARGLGRYGARAVTLTLVAAVAAASVIAGADEGVAASSRVAERLPAVVEDVEQLPVVGDWLASRDASTWVSQQIEDLPQRLSAARPSTWLPGVTARLVDLFWVAVLAAALLFDGTRLVAAGLRLVPASRRRQTERLVGATGAALMGYAAGAALLATINAGVVFTIAVVLGLGLAPVVAVWAFVWNFVPQIGGFMGGLPLVLFALVAGPGHALVAGATFLAYQLLENHVIQPAIIGAAIDVPPWGTLLAALAGGAAGGVLGAVLLTPLVGVVRVVLVELRRDDFPGHVARVASEERRLVHDA